MTKIELDELETKGMGWAAYKKIEEMIKAKQINFDDPWTFTNEDQNKILGSNGDEWGAYAGIHAGRDISFERDDKRRYIYPIIKDGVVYKSALIQAKNKAVKDENWSAHTIDDLLGQIAEQEGIHVDNSDIVRQSRVDFFPMTEEEDSFMEEKFKKTDQGYLKGRAIITNVGVFSYFNPDTGEVIRELRPPEEVFDSESMRSFEMLPVTDKHPDVLVDAENIKEFQAGSSGSEIRKGDFHLSAPLTVTNPDTVDGIERDGHRAISCGYSVVLVDKSGIWMGVPYDMIQTQIRGNHIAVNIDNARAGDDARIKMDSNFSGAYSIMDSKNKKFNKEDTTMTLKKINIDGVDYEGEAELIKAYQKEKKRADDLTTATEEAVKATSKLQGEHDALKDENIELKKKNDELEKSNPEKVKAEIKARVALIDMAKSVEIEVTDEMENVDIMKQVIFKAYPKTDAAELKAFQEKLDKAEPAYIDAYFEAAVSNLKERGDIKLENKQTISDSTPSTNEDEKPADPEKARVKMINDMQENWKLPKDKVVN